MATFKPAKAARSPLDRYKGKALLLVGVDDGHGLTPTPTPGKRTPPLPMDIVIGGKVVRKKGERIFENEQNRGVARAVIDALLRCGIGAVESAPGDADASLSARQRAFKAAGCTITISCHKNGAGSGSQWLNARGVSVFVHDDNPGPSDEALRLGQLLLDRLPAALGKPTRGVKEKDENGDYTGRLVVCRKALSMTNEKYIGCPAVLLELGFQDQIDDAPEMLNPQFWTLAGEEIVKNVCEFFAVPYVAPGAVTPKPPEPKPDPKPKPPPAPKPVVVPALTGKVVRVDAKDVLNVRSGAGVGNRVLGGMEPGTTMTVLEMPGNGWAKVQQGKLVGWASLAYIQLASAKVAGKTNSSSLNVRKVPDSSPRAPKPIGSLAKGAKVTIIGRLPSGWLAIEYAKGPGGVAFVYGSYVST